MHFIPLNSSLLLTPTAQFKSDNHLCLFAGSVPYITKSLLVIPYPANSKCTLLSNGAPK